MHVLVSLFPSYIPTTVPYTRSCLCFFSLSFSLAELEHPNFSSFDLRSLRTGIMGVVFDMIISYGKH